MILYHGGMEAISSPRVIKGEIGRDFGHAFYTTDIFDQAKRKAWIAVQSAPVVNVYEFDELQAGKLLKIKAFEGPSLDWLELVLNCRANPDYSHEFDIVTGNIANDNVGETVSFVQQGIMRKEDALARLKFERINNQIAFCTPRSLEFLKYVKHLTGEELG